jgi:hypothetical protein
MKRISRVTKAITLFQTFPQGMGPLWAQAYKHGKNTHTNTKKRFF